MNTIKNIVGIIIVLFCSFSIYGQDINDLINIKVKRTYLEGKLINENYYDQQGRLIKTAHPNYKYYRGEYHNGQVHTISYEYDTLAWIYEYSKDLSQTKTYKYHIKDNQKSMLELTDEHYYKNGLLLKTIKYFDNVKSGFEHFKYDKYGNIVKIKDEFGTNRYKYIYNSDLLIVRKTMYSNFRINYNYRIIYEYNCLKQKEKAYKYNYDKRLTEITLYFYDEKQRIIKIETTNLDIYTDEHQRREKKYITSYKYNNNNFV
jgi:hypothetical protein